MVNDLNKLETPIVSVLMTSFNREDFIAEAIESVLSSTYTDFELIICDDSSVDETVLIANKYAALDSRVKVFVNDKNLGDYSNRNKAASFASGKYLKYLDSDDIIYPESLKIMVQHLENYPEAGYAFCDKLIQDNAMPFPILYTSLQAFQQHYLQYGFFYAGPGGTIIRKSVFESLGGFSGKRFLGDTELLMKISLKYAVLKIQPALIWWRIHNDQEANIESRNPLIIAERYNLMCYFLRLSVLTDSEKSKAAIILDKMMARNILRQMVINMRFAVGFKMIKLTGFTIFDLIKAFYINNRLKKMWVSN